MYIHIFGYESWIKIHSRAKYLVHHITCQQLILNLRILIDNFFNGLEVFDWDQNRQENTDLTVYFSKEKPNSSLLQQDKKCKKNGGFRIGCWHLMLVPMP